MREPLNSEGCLRCTVHNRTNGPCSFSSSLIQVMKPSKMWDDGAEVARGNWNDAKNYDHRRTRTCNLLVPSAIEAKRATIAPGSLYPILELKRFQHHIHSSLSKGIEKKSFDHRRGRTCNLLIRSQTRCHFARRP